MSTPHPHDPDPSAELRERWVARYGPVVAMQLEPDRRYSLVRAGSAEYAFTDYDRYVRALGQVWSSRLLPEALPSAMGSELLDAAPNLEAVDPDPEDLRGPDERGRSTFS